MPDLLQNPLRIVFWFRYNETAMSADIDAMFLQVAFPNPNANFPLFLWTDQLADRIRTYEYKRNVFGAKSLPTCVNFALLKAGYEQAKLLPEASKCIKRNFFKDDLVKSVRIVEQGKTSYNELVRCLANRGYDLRKWVSSSPVMNEKFLPKHRS